MGIVRLMVATDHELLRAGVSRLLQAQPDVEIVSEVSCGTDLFEKIRTSRAEVLLLMLPFRGVELIAQIKAARPNLRILVLSMSDDTLLSLRAMRAGASGCINTYCTAAELLSALCKVASTGRYLDPEVAQNIAFAASSSIGSEIEQLLSHRELQIFPLLTEGKCIKSIANELSISDKTVSTHKSNILSKLGLKNTADLVRFAMRNELELQCL